MAPSISFHHDENQWIEQEILGAQIPFTVTAFGTEVSLRDDTRLVSDLIDDTAGLNAGAVYVYERSGMTWTFQSLLTVNVGIQWDFYGRSVDHDVDADGTPTIAVSPRNMDGGFLRGTVYRYGA